MFSPRSHRPRTLTIPLHSPVTSVHFLSASGRCDEGPAHHLFFFFVFMVACPSKRRAAHSGLCAKATCHLMCFTVPLGDCTHILAVFSGLFLFFLFFLSSIARTSVPPPPPQKLAPLLVLHPVKQADSQADHLLWPLEISQAQVELLKCHSVRLWQKSGSFTFSSVFLQ